MPPDKGIVIRYSTEADIEALAKVWFTGWQDAHLPILPPEFAGFRTLDGFRARVSAGLGGFRVAVRQGLPVGLSLVKGDELNQFYVAAEARGTTVAPMLMQDAVNRLKADGHRTAWLACAVGNARAARFYEKSGWRRSGVMPRPLDTQAGVFPIEVWRYEIDLAPAGG